MTDMSDMHEWNRQIIEEFRANAGKVGGPFEGAPMVLLTTTGAKSGLPRTVPLVYLPDGDRVVVFGSKAGAPTHPDWYHNLLADPEVTVEVGTDTYRARARVLDGEERDALFARQVAAFPRFAEYQRTASRRIPVIALERTA